MMYLLGIIATAASVVTSNDCAGLDQLGCESMTNCNMLNGECVPRKLRQLGPPIDGSQNDSTGGDPGLSDNIQGGGEGTEESPTTEQPTTEEPSTEPAIEEPATEEPEDSTTGKKGCCGEMGEKTAQLRDELAKIRTFIESQ